MSRYFLVACGTTLNVPFSCLANLQAKGETLWDPWWAAWWLCLWGTIYKHLWVSFSSCAAAWEMMLWKVSGGSGGGGGLSLHCGGGRLHYLCLWFVMWLLLVLGMVLQVLLLLLCCSYVWAVCVRSSLANMCWWFSTFCRITAYYSNAKSLSLPLPLEPSVLRVWQLLCIDFH